MVDGRLRLAATWPPARRTPAVDAPATTGPGRRAVAGAPGGELLGVLVVQEREHVPLTPVEERLFAGLADQAGLVLRGARLRAELVQPARGAVRARRGTATVAGTAGRRAGRRAAAARARHPRRRAAASGRARGEPAARPDLGRDGHRERADRLLAEQVQAATATIETIDQPVARHLPERCSSTKVLRPRSGRRSPQPAAGRTVAGDLGRLPGRRRGRGVLLLPGGAAERRQALVGDGDPRGSARGRCGPRA